jgi:hypothetical protein
LSSAHLEAWGPFGRGWSLKNFSATVVEPETFTLSGCPNAWSPGFEQPLVADVVYLDARTSADLEKYRGKLKGAIVLASQLPGTESATDGARVAPLRTWQQSVSILLREGAALVVFASPGGEDGTIFVTAVTLPVPATNILTQGSTTAANRCRAWQTHAPAFPPQITLAAADYNRLARLCQTARPVKMKVDLQVQFHDEDLMAYNTIAELPGTDLQDQIVMLGAHLDSWHTATGATDNAAGVAATMEALRILRARDLHPRRTIRIGLWSGEEQGLFGSRAYVSNHFGYYTSGTGSSPAATTKGSTNAANRAEANSPALARKLVQQPEYEKLSAYFNLDNGAGKVRGLYLQGNEATRGPFRRWLSPLADLGAEALNPASTFGTDHTPFDAIGLPAFEFIQDPLDYRMRTHHSNQDVFECVPAENLRQAAVVLATIAYEAAMADEQVPRKH